MRVRAVTPAAAELPTVPSNAIRIWKSYDVAAVSPVMETEVSLCAPSPPVSATSVQVAVHGVDEAGVVLERYCHLYAVNPFANAEEAGRGSDRVNDVAVTLEAAGADTVGTAVDVPVALAISELPRMPEFVERIWKWYCVFATSPVML